MAHIGCQPKAEDPHHASANSHLTAITGESELATWTCTGDPCPWGESASNDALAWPVSAEPVAMRLGYTTSPAVYLPADSANGLTISIESGSADVYAGEPQAESHRLLASVSAGESYQVSDLDTDEVLSVQSDSSFGYRVTPPDLAGQPDAGQPDAGPTLDGAPIASQSVTWTCAGTPCPWGDSTSGETLVWPAASHALTTRLGYNVSAGVYLSSTRANGATISVEAGEANAYAGFPDEDPHRLLAAITPEEPLVVGGLDSGEVLSVQADSPFTYRIALPPPSEPDPGDDPVDVIPSIQAFWRCNIPECDFADWTGAVINWPASVAYQTNDRSADQSRSVFSADGTPLFPYMGSWAQGCEVTAEAGVALIIEWQRGTDVWRETWLEPRQSHVIDLVPPEDGAMIETYDGSPGFGVSLKHCTPQPLQPAPGTAPSAGVKPRRGPSAGSAAPAHPTPEPASRRRGRAGRARA